LYLEVLANVEATLDETMPLGKGDIFQYHMHINEEDYMHSAFAEHI